MTGWRIAAGAAVALLATSTAVAAQGKCDIKTSSPFQLRSAEIYSAKLNGGKPGEANKHAQNAVGVLTKDADKIGNEAGRNYLLARVLTWWTQRPQATIVVRRGDVGYTEMPDATIDLIAAIDSAADRIEAAKPECKASADTLRRQVWPGQINTASKFINQGEIDSASVYLARAEMLMPGSPYNAYYRAVLVQKKGEPSGDAFYAAYKAVTGEALQDSNLATIRRQSLYNSGVLALEEGQGLEGAERMAKMKVAASRFEEFIKEFPNVDQTANAQGALARALAASGDTAAAVGMFAKMLDEPRKYTSLQLFEASVAAVRANRLEDATKLLELGLERNSHYRDALFNLATLYHRQKAYDKVMPIAQRLLEVDPNNPDNFRIYAGAMQGPAEQYKAEAEKLRNDRAKRAQFDAVMKKLAAANDSVIKYVELSQKAPVRLTVQSLETAGATTTLVGSIENRTEAAKTFELQFTFLDAQGNVVSSGSTTIEAGAQERKDFRVETSGDGIVAWKYAPLK